MKKTIAILFGIVILTMYIASANIFVPSNGGANDYYGLFTSIRDFFFYSNVTPSACQNSIANTSWGTWTDMESCTILDLKQQNRTKHSYDVNSCGNYTNVTYTEMQNTSCNYCSYSIQYDAWSAWTNTTLSCGNRTRLLRDNAFQTCCNVTNITTDCYQSDEKNLNNTYSETGTLSCNLKSNETDTNFLMVGGSFAFIWLLLGRKNRIVSSIIFFTLAVSILLFSITYPSIALIFIVFSIANLIYDFIPTKRL